MGSATLIVLIAVAVLVLGLVLILVFLTHGFFLQRSLRTSRILSIPQWSGFIPGLEHKAGSQTCHNGGGDTTGGGLQAAGENA